MEESDMSHFEDMGQLDASSDEDGMIDPPVKRKTRPYMQNTKAKLP